MRTHSDNKSDIIVGFAGTISPSIAIIQGKIATELSYDLIDIKNINIDIVGSKVIVTGIIDTLDRMRNIIYAIWESPGVSTVENKLKVLHHTPQ